MVKDDVFTSFACLPKNALPSQVFSTLTAVNCLTIVILFGYWCLEKESAAFMEGIYFFVYHLSSSSVAQLLPQGHNLSGLYGVLLFPQYSGLSIEKTKDIL